MQPEDKNPSSEPLIPSSRNPSYSEGETENSRLLSSMRHKICWIFTRPCDALVNFRDKYQNNRWVMRAIIFLCAVGAALAIIGNKETFEKKMGMGPVPFPLGLSLLGTGIALFVFMNIHKAECYEECFLRSNDPATGPVSTSTGGTRIQMR